MDSKHKIIQGGFPAKCGAALFVLFSLLWTGTPAQIITVKQDGTGDFTLIQDAIDASSQGDTVLVYPGTYFENLVIEGAGITLGSLYLTTGDPQYKYQTVVNGNRSGSCIAIIETDNVRIAGLSLTNGSGTEGYAGTGRYIGGGLFAWLSDAVEIIHCHIYENEVIGYGGGCDAASSTLYLSSTSIHNNYASRFGGGIHAGHYEYTPTITFDTVNRCSIYLNYSGQGCDISKGYSYDTLHLALDTFSVMQPGLYHIWEIDQLGFPSPEMHIDILNAKIEAQPFDLYVNPTGSDTNSGLSAAEPLKTISYALSKVIPDEDTLRTIHLADGLYSKLSTAEKFPLNLRSNLHIRGESRDGTILDGDSLTMVLYGNELTNNYTVSDLTLQRGYGNESDGAGNLLLMYTYDGNFENLLIQKGSNYFKSALNTGGSTEIFFTGTEICYNKRGYKAIAAGSGNNPMVSPATDTVTFINCKIHHNERGYDLQTGPGGAFYLGSSLLSHDAFIARIINCEIVENTEINPLGFMGACAILAHENVECYIVNSTIADNVCLYHPSSHAVGIQDSCEMHIYNSIIYGNTPRQLGLAGDGTFPSNMNVYYSDIEGGEAEIFNTTPLNILHYDGSNIEKDPQFLNSGDFPYALQSSSPCIDAGTLELPPEVYLPEYDLAGNPRIYGGAIDMGAYEWFPVGIPKTKTSSEKEHNPLKVFPNPFRYTTAISFENPRGGDVRVAAYDLKGNLAGIVYDTPSAPNKATFWWDGKGTGGFDLPAGIYLVVLEINGKRTGSQKVSKN